MARLFQLPGTNTNITINLDQIVYVKSPRIINLDDQDKQYTIVMSTGEEFLVYDTNYWQTNMYPYDKFMKRWAG